MNSKNENVWVKDLRNFELASRPGLGGRWKRLVEPSEANLGMIVGMGELGPGETLLWQQHPLPEAFCVLAGQVDIHWKEQQRESSIKLVPGQTFYMASHTPHDFRNTGREPLLLYFFKIKSELSKPVASGARSEVASAKTFNTAELTPVAGINGRWKRYVLPSPENFGMIVGLGELPPGTRMGWHAHADPEIFYVLQGRGRACWEWEGKEFSDRLSPGRAFYKIGKVRHDMENIGDEPLLGVAYKIQPPASPQPSPSAS
jgi:quercetin dioxygenase-like cupin family protein